MKLLTKLLMGVLGIAGPLAAGMLLTVEVETGRSGVSRKHEIRVQGSWLRMDTPSAEYRQSTLYNDKTGGLVLVDEQQKSFRQVDFEQTAARQKDSEARQAQFMKAMEKNIRKLPPEKQIVVRSRLNRRMAAHDTTDMECQRVAEGEAVGSWSADRYECSVGSRKVREVWTVPWEESGLDAEEVAALQAFVQRRGGSFGGPLGMRSGGLSLSADAHPGLAVRVLHIRDGAARQGHEVSSIKREEFDASLFAVDASYSEAEAANFPLAIR